ncbi:MAG: DUF4331 domain-containing protein [Nitrococcus sp.]|nr:DUF4331 domain-containing protein [Nitrococcus sp.]
MKKAKPLVAGIAAGLAVACAGVSTVQASSHAEAPFITKLPKVDGTDFYMFRSYEPGKTASVTLLSNYLRLQSPWGGPNYFALSDDGLYEIHIDNNGDAQPDITFRFQFDKKFRNIALPTGTTADVPIPLVISGPVDQVKDPNLNRIQTYTLNVVRNGDQATAQPVMSTAGDSVFVKPMDYIGQKTFGNAGAYQTYAKAHIYDITIPGCSETGRVFVGQRREGFYINIGETFDLINIAGTTLPNAALIGGRDTQQNVTDLNNITTLALEVPVGCLTAGGDGSGIIGGWMDSYLPQARVLIPTPAVSAASGQGLADYRAALYAGAFTQVSRLGHPLINEVVIGLPAKNLFNTSEPVNDVQNFGNYVLYPTLPVLVASLFNLPIVPATPRLDLAEVFITGLQVTVDGQPFNFTHPPSVGLEPPFEGGGEILRLNTTIEPNMNAQVGSLGVLECDLAGFPNGRRPVDDVVDITLTVAEGALLPNDQGLGGVYELQYCDVDSQPNTTGLQPVVVNEGQVITDGTIGSAGLFIHEFPYLAPPLAGSPNDADNQAPDSAAEVP